MPKVRIEVLVDDDDTERVTQALIETARSAVQEKFGINLECEVRIIGDAA